MEKITIIGLGNMGGALVRGLKNPKNQNQLAIEIYDVDETKVNNLVDGVRVSGLKSLADVQVDKNILILCIKPQDLAGISAIFGGRIGPGSLLISILAGKKTTTIAKDFGFQGPVIRAMPNIAAVIGEAATAMCCNDVCEAEHRQVADVIFKGVGEAYWIRETLMDAVTGLSGSGPAYIYMVIEALTDGGLKMGMPRDLAFKLATQTVLGAAGLVKSTGLHPAILKDQVTTPAGTTISALHVLEERGLRSMFVNAVEKATMRSAELGKDS